jgi:hypothetical protein
MGDFLLKAAAVAAALALLLVAYTASPAVRPIVREVNVQAVTMIDGSTALLYEYSVNGDHSSVVLREGDLEEYRAYLSRFARWDR